MTKLLALLLLASACWGQLAIDSTKTPGISDTQWTWAQAKKTGTAAEQAQVATQLAYITSYYNRFNAPIDAAHQGGAYEVAFAYKVDPTSVDSPWRDHACQWIKFSVDTADGNTGGTHDANSDFADGNNLRWSSPRLAVAYSILRSHCDVSDATVTTKFRDMATRMWNFFKQGGTSPFFVYTTPYRVNNNIGIGQITAMMAVAVAAYDADEFTDPLTWVESMKTTLMDAYVVPCHTTSNVTTAYHVCYGGGSTEGMTEYGPEADQLTVELYNIWRVNVTGVDYTAAANSFAAYVMDWQMKGTSPWYQNGTYYPLYGSYYYRDALALGSPPYWMFFQTYQRKMIGRLYWHFRDAANTTYRDYAQFWSKSIDPVTYLYNPPSSQNSQKQSDEVLYQDPDATGVDYRTQSLDPWHVTPSMMMVRSDWTTNASWFGILSMIEGADHMHGDSGTFNFARKGKWLTREVPGYLNLRSVSPNALHNSLIANGHGSYSGATRGGGSFDKSQNEGTNGFKRRSGGYMAECNSAYCAGELETAAAYKFTGYAITSDVSDMRRNFIYFNPDFFIIADRVKYATGVTARTIFPVQTEKGAATISGSTATIANASQRLHVTVVAPAGHSLHNVQLNSLKAIEFRRRTDDVGAVFFDGGSMPTSATTLRFSGLTGAYAALNTDMSCAPQSLSSGYEPYQDGAAYNGERLICTKAGAWAGLPAYAAGTHGIATVRNSADTAVAFPRDLRWVDPDINPTAPTTIVTHDPYAVYVASNTAVNEDAFLVAFQGADSVDTPATVTGLTVSTSNATALSVTLPGGSLIEYIIPKTLTPTFPITFTRTGPAVTQYWHGLTPGTTYKLSDAGGATTLNTTGAGTSVVASNSGLVIAAVDESISSPTITLVATPASLAASCVNGGSNPANQTIALTVTGDGGEAAVSFSDDSAAISETLSGGAAPQTTPQTMTVAFGGCSGLSVGTHNLNISVTSGTTYVVNSPLTIPVTLTVTANPLIAASPASVNFTATVSGANPADQTVTITRTVSGDLGSITDDAAWLTVTPSSATGITSQDLTLAVDIAGLDPGQHTATITVASSGASNTPITIPVLLALDNPPAIGVEPRPGTTMIQIPFRAPSRAACTIRACTTAACSSVVASASDGGGHPIRIYTLTGLTAATTYTVQTVCGTEIKARQVTTRAATGGPTITLPIDVFNAVGADNIVVDYGADDTLSETAVNGSCSASRCTATITWTNAFRLLWFQITYRDSGNNVLKTEAIRSRSLIPE